MNINNEQLSQYDYIEDEFYDKALRTYSTAIGEFFMEYSALEHELNVTIAEIINSRTHEIGYKIMETMNMRPKIDLFYRLYNSMGNITGSNKQAKLKEV